MGFLTFPNSAALTTGIGLADTDTVMAVESGTGSSSEAPPVTAPTLASPEERDSGGIEAAAAAATMAEAPPSFERDILSFSE